MILAAFYSSLSVVVLVIAMASWVLFWGTLSASVLAFWRAPNLHSLWMGLAGPIGPLIALGLGLAKPKRPVTPGGTGTEVEYIESTSTSGPRVVP